jgi:antirestriction protein ArdC
LSSVERCPQGRDRLDGRVRQPVHQDRHGRKAGEEFDREIPFLQGLLAVFNVAQIDGLLDHHYWTACGPSLMRRPDRAH